MTKYVIALVLNFSLLSFALQAQTTELPDWLVQVAQQKHQQPEAMLALLQQHQDQLKTLNRDVQANGYLQQASLFSALGRHLQQQEAAEQGLQLLAEQQSAVKVELLYELGFAREMQADYPQALQYYLQGIQIAQALENEKLLLTGQINHAAVLSEQNQDQQALAMLKDTYQRAQRLGDIELQADANAALGLLYASLAYETDAVSLFNTALTLYEQLGWQKDQITVLFNLARTYSYLEQYPLSLQTYNKMLQLALQVDDNINLYHAYLGLAITSSDSGAGDAALSYIAKAEQYLPLLQSTLHLSTHHYEKAVIYRKLKQTSLAMQELLLAERSMTEEGVAEYSSTRLNIWYLKSQLLAEQGEYARAYKQLEEFVFLFQDARNKENELAVEQLRVGFEHERQIQQNRLLEQDNELKALRLQQSERERQVQLLWLAILSCSTLVLLILLLWQLTRQKNKQQTADDETSLQDTL